MTYAVWTPSPPTDNLRDLADGERRILFDGRFSRAVWDLEAIQASLKSDPPLKIFHTVNSQWSMKELLKWNGEEFKVFLGCLSKSRYIGSQWCYAPKGNSPHACDVYVMGFNRLKGIENPLYTPWAYVKFGFIGPNYTTLAVFSAHPEGQYQGETK